MQEKVNIPDLSVEESDNALTYFDKVRDYLEACGVSETTRKSVEKLLLIDINKRYLEDDEFFRHVCAIPRIYLDIEDYKKDLHRWLMLSSWHFTAEHATERILEEEKTVKECFEKEWTIADTGIEIGYSCG